MLIASIIDPVYAPRANCSSTRIPRLSQHDAFKKTRPLDVAIGYPLQEAEGCMSRAIGTWVIEV
jgi:hypothetical protein